MHLKTNVFEFATDSVCKSQLTASYFCHGLHQFWHVNYQKHTRWVAGLDVRPNIKTVWDESCWLNATAAWTKRADDELLAFFFSCFERAMISFHRRQSVCVCVCTCAGLLLCLCMPSGSVQGFAWNFITPSTHTHKPTRNSLTHSHQLSGVHQYSGAARCVRFKAIALPISDRMYRWDVMGEGILGYELHKTCADTFVKVLLAAGERAKRPCCDGWTLLSKSIYNEKRSLLIKLMTKTLMKHYLLQVLYHKLYHKLYNKKKIYCCKLL